MGCWPDGAPVSWPPPLGDTASPRRSSLASKIPKYWRSKCKEMYKVFCQKNSKWVKRKPPYTNPHPVSDWRCGCTQRREKEKLWDYYNTGSQQVSAPLQAPWERRCYQQAESGWYASSQPQHQTGHWRWWSWWGNHIQQCQAFSSTAEEEEKETAFFGFRCAEQSVCV